MSFYNALLGRALAGGGGGSEPVLISKTITSNGTYDASDDNADGYKDVSVSVPNTYTESDEDKVVHNGALVAQTSDTVTQNGTVDTTLISSLLVNVSASGSVATKLTTTDTKITSSDIYIIEGTIYYYIFGYLYGSGSPSYAEFSIPSDFDTSNIGSTLGGVLFNITNPQSSYTMDNIYNNKIPIPFYSGKQSGIFIPFEKNS